MMEIWKSSTELRLLTEIKELLEKIEENTRKDKSKK